MKRARFRRPEVRRAVVLLPNGFTLFNLFCGIYAMVLAARGRFGTAAFFVVLGGVADSLDGRIAPTLGNIGCYLGRGDACDARRSGIENRVG